MALNTMDFKKLPADRHIKVAIGPSGGTTLGITEIDEPTPAELNNTGGTSGMINASKTISWNDFDFGTQASETLNEPSLADAGSYVEFGTANYGGGMSYFLPADWDDNSNVHKLIWDLTKEAYHSIDVAVRVDGARQAGTVDFANGDFVSAYRVNSGGDANPFTNGESKRRTVSYSPAGEMSHYTVVGDHAITAIAPSSFEVDDKGRIRASQQGRDRTNALRFTSSNANVIRVYNGGFYEVIAAGSATVTITDPGTNDTATVTVTATA